MPQHVLIAGSSGLVGRAVVSLLAQRSDVAATALVRRIGSSGARGAVREKIFAFAPPGDYAQLGVPPLPCDILFCCLGTTQRAAGSRAAFRAVDYDYPVLLAKAVLANNPQAQIGLVSSIGADKPTGFYLETKAALEAELRRMAVNLVIARPSLLLGDRQEARPVEAVAQRLAPLVTSALDLLPASWRTHTANFEPVAATAVAAALVEACVGVPPSGHRVLVGRDFRV